ncbi:MAG: hypothetical protein AAF125_17635 [Chloroflexota bacterium]
MSNWFVAIALVVVMYFTWRDVAGELPGTQKPKRGNTSRQTSTLATTVAVGIAAVWAMNGLLVFLTRMFGVNGLMAVAVVVLALRWWTGMATQRRKREAANRQLQEAMNDSDDSSKEKSETSI